MSRRQPGGESVRAAKPPVDATSGWYQSVVVKTVFWETIRFVSHNNRANFRKILNFSEDSAA